MVIFQTHVPDYMSLRYQCVHPSYWNSWECDIVTSKKEKKWYKPKMNKQPVLDIRQLKLKECKACTYIQISFQFLLVNFKAYL